MTWQGYGMTCHIVGVWHGMVRGMAWHGMGMVSHGRGNGMAWHVVWYGIA